MNNDISIVIPVYNYQNVIQTIYLLSSEVYPGKKEIILVYDNPKVIIDNLFDKILKKYKIRLIINKTNQGLAGSYNVGINNAIYSNIFIIHEDCIPEDRFLIKNMLKKLNSSKDIFIINAKIVTQTRWKDYNFWNKILNFRHMEIIGAVGKATMFKRELISEVGLFDSKTFHTAGEDMDFNYRLDKKNIKINEVEDRVYHIHNYDEANLISILKKEWQFGEAHGAFKRKYGILKRVGYIDFELRIILFIVCGLLPFFIISLAQSLINYSKTGWMAGVFTYPLIGMLVLLTQTIAATKAFITGRQV